MDGPTASSTLFTVAHRFTSPDIFPSDGLHPVATSADPNSTLLRELLDVTAQMSHSLNAYAAQPFTDPKLVSLLRQHGNISHLVYSSDQSARNMVETLRKRAGVNYIEDIPLERSTMIGWCLSRIETWGTTVGMEIFKEEEKEGHITVVLGGKVLVLDIEFRLTRSDPKRPTIEVVNVKTSYAIHSGESGTTSSTTEGSNSLAGFLTDSLRAYLSEVQKDDEVQDCLEAARLGREILKSLKYLMKLDQLAVHEGDKGLKWFTNIDQLASLTEPFAKEEAKSVSTSLTVNPVPLDIFLLRAHALPLPYLRSPSMSFLVHISPLAYLTLLRSSKVPSGSAAGTQLPDLDVPFSHLRPYLASHPKPKGVTLATLRLVDSSHPQVHPASVGVTSFSSRPTFSLAPLSPDVDYFFPSVPPESTVKAEAAPSDGLASGSLSHPLSILSPSLKWILDFTEDGNHLGVIMSQSRMREIETLINPLSGMDHLHGVGMMSFGNGSWVDILLNPTNLVSPERYTALYTSPNNVHPPLQLRLTSSEEPGFILERVHVHTIREVWGVLEVVKEQCWLNEVLLSGEWMTEGLTGIDMNGEAMDEDVTDADLEAVLNGTIKPSRIPVNVYIPSASDPDPAHRPLFDSAASLESLDVPLNRPRIIMTCPERPPRSGVMEICVGFDSSKERAVRVDVSNAIERDLNVDTLEEASRRGAILGLAGRIWASTQP